MARTSTYAVPCAWGTCLLDAQGEDVVRVSPPTTAAAGSDAARPIAEAPSELRELGERIAAYLEGEPVEVASPEQVERWLRATGMGGARLEMLVTLTKVPWGMVVTYGELAELAGYPRAARAAGSACASNPLLLVVPCHRVVPAGRALGKYGSLGPGYKQKLLELEGVSLR